jgi:hypothetical protein
MDEALLWYVVYGYLAKDAQVDVSVCAIALN